jgi:hypothetical protein
LLPSGGYPSCHAVSTGLLQQWKIAQHGTTSSQHANCILRPDLTWQHATIQRAHCCTGTSHFLFLTSHFQQPAAPLIALWRLAQLPCG